MASVWAESAVPHPASIRTLLLRLILAIAVPLAALEAWNLYDDYQDNRQRAHQQVLHLAQVTASETARFLGQARNIAAGLAARPAVRALDPARCDPILKDFLGLAPRFANVTTMTMDGTIVCSAVPLAGPARGEPERFLKLMRAPGELTVGKAAPGVITGKWVVPVGVPLVDARGAIAGAVVLPLDLLKIPLLPSVESLLAQTIVGLIDGDGTVLARSLEAERFVGTRAGAGRTAVREKSGTADVAGIDGIARIQGFARVPGTDWIAIASIPSASVYAGVTARAAASALVSIAILATALLLAARLSRRIRQPIAALADAAGEVAAGNLAARAPVAGSAEIAELGTQFNRMLDNRLRADAALRESENKYRSLVETAADGILTLDVQGRLMDVNAAGCQLLGYSRDELLKMKHSDIVTAGEVVRLATEMARLSAEQVLRCEWQCRRKDGTTFPGEVSATVLPGGRRLVILRDITERERSEIATKQAENRLRLATEAALIGTWDWDIESNRVRWDSILMGLFWLEPGQLETDIEAWLQRVHAEDQSRVRAAIQNALRNRAHYAEEFRITGPAGEERWIAAEGTAFGEAPSRAVRMVGVAQDITERKRTEGERHRLLEVLERSLNEIYMFDPETLRFSYVNQSALRNLGYSREAMHALTPLTLKTRFSETSFRELISRLRDSGDQVLVFETAHRRADGSTYPVEVHLQLVQTAERPTFLAIILDITVRKHDEDELREGQERLQALTRRLLEVQETERRAIARELHDEVGSVLTAVKLNLQSLERARPRGSGKAAIADGLALVDGAILSVRALSLDLRPAVLDDLGLIPALKWYCERMAQRAAIPIELALEAIDLKLAPQLESACFRIVQEAVTNALRHASARRIQVALRRNDSGFVLEIADDGGGFDMAAARKSGLAGESSGLLGMEERATLIGGRFKIESAPGAGARVRVEFSVPEGGFG